MTQVLAKFEPSPGVVQLGRKGSALVRVLQRCQPIDLYVCPYAYLCLAIYEQGFTMGIALWSVMQPASSTMLFPNWGLGAREASCVALYLSLKA
jgi:hypothetical protein